MTIEATQSETTPTEALPFRVTSGAYENLPKMPEEEYPGTDGYIGDVYENPDGSVMCSGYFELNHTDAPLYYEYQYDEMKIVLEGEFLLENKETGQKIVAKAKDAIFFPKGSKIYFSTPDRALAYYCGHRDATLL
ncbi:ethanolamine utilization protein [Gordonia amarae]|uniref:Ethanolamine utilization protein EutQ n=2 Tax=Gordonia amarae TaxID=36821 RepID=G7GRU7_9ACTN|nr:ethanolamine utilization protein [Gordonia amarae]MCS3876980.1 ethanolamine utilization protein EutQ (cupin superfamily) [Gordonia amarae]QHN15801.1 ethanolamine utilization protein [Gordonia amarae]QHN20369.1 ethanolamine utilization protein [Gordonia amarae]QHN29221.1 ethanolamine utilization protein [Gordonia amarae]QHN38000.1 ethanolamine utilization protein [Gordonia amarae]